MSHRKFNRKTYEDAGETLGHLIQNGSKSHSFFWLNLYKNTNPEIFNRIQFFIILTLSGLLGFIYQHIWTFIFGSLAPVTFPFGLIKLVIFGTTAYVGGFEFGFKYSVYIDNLVNQSEITTDLPKVLTEYTPEVNETVPLKKRRNSEPRFSADSMERRSGDGTGTVSKKIL
jgi:hypothetical protein